MKKHWKTYLIWAAAAEGAGALAGWLIRDGVALYDRTAAEPPLSPPAALFPVVWTVLYALMGIAAARVALSPPSGARTLGLRLWIVQLSFNFLWSLIFFGLRTPLFALLWLAALWALILWTLLVFRRVDRPAGWMLVPYLVWVTFAVYLNFGVWLLNR